MLISSHFVVAFQRRVLAKMDFSLNFLDKNMGLILH